MSDAGDSSYVVVQSSDKNTKENVPRIPHRPAPPVPVPKYKMTAGMFEIKRYDGLKNRIFFNIQFTKTPNYDFSLFFSREEILGGTS